MSKKNTRADILKYLEGCDWPSTTEMVAKAVNVSWNTAQVHLLKLVHEGLVKFKRVGRQNQFWLKRIYDREMK